LLLQKYYFFKTTPLFLKIIFKNYNVLIKKISKTTLKGLNIR